jgi:hypothetical protein
MRPILTLLAVFALASAAPIASASADDGEAVDFSALSWLEGCWSGEGLGGEVSECWMSTPDGRMTGAFQMVSGGELQFSEMLMLGEAGGVIGYHVKHFNADFTGWEERTEQVSFPHVSLSEDRAEFEGLIYALGEDGTLTVQLDMHTSDGGVSVVEFSMRAVE